jgi:AraC-like DNA-binding protein
MTQNSISVALIRPLLEVSGASAFENNDQASIDQRILKLLKDPDARINQDDADVLISTLLRKSNSDNLCVLAGQQTVSQSSCQLQHLFLCSSTLREALYYLEKYSLLLSDGLEVNVTRTRDNIIKVKFPVPENSFLSQERHRLELLIGTLLGWMKQLCGPDLQFTDIELPFPQPTYGMQYGQTWKSRIHYNCSDCSIQFQARWLDHGLHNTNPHILNMIKRDVEDQFKKLTRTGSLSDRIRKAIDQNKLSLKANQQVVSEHFHISARTLNRHLQKEGTSLKQIITECRVNKAKLLLVESNDSIEQIALQLGLSGRRTLDRIFIKQTDDSPAQYRSKHRNRTHHGELRAVAG